MRKRKIIYYSKEIEKLVEEFKIDKKVCAELTSWEINLLQLAALGLDTKQISKIIFISPHTVKSHLATIYKKLNAENRANAVYIAMKLRIIA